MTNILSGQLRGEADKLDNCADRIREDGLEQLLQSLDAVAQHFARAWSGSSLGYHSRVYYNAFNPPPGAYFSAEWGSYTATLNRTTGDWREYRHEEVLELILKRAADPDLGKAERIAREVRADLEGARAECLSILSIFSGEINDVYIEELKTEIGQLKPLSEADALQVQLSTTAASHDHRAVAEGRTAAPHQEILARVAAIKGSFLACRDLAILARRGASHIDLAAEARVTDGERAGGKIFIGHGRSPAWRELKDFIQDELGLQCDEFNRVEVAGTTTIDRLKRMLDEAVFAFLVLTAEDEWLDGTLAARENVIHETGLFQGLLGFERAIVMLESDCNEFSNIHGLSSLRFDSGKIDGVFDRVRGALKREGLIS